MTFEERVAVALAHILSGELSFTARRSETLTDFDVIALALAPRVAAAIEAARLPHRLTRDTDGPEVPRFDTALEASHWSALRALRGEPEPDAPPPNTLRVKLVVRGEGTMTPPKSGATDGD